MAFADYPHRTIVVRGERLVEVNVGGPHGYAYVTESIHADLLAHATTAIGYRQAVLRHACMFGRRPADWGQEVPDA